MFEWHLVARLQTAANYTLKHPQIVKGHLESVFSLCVLGYCRNMVDYDGGPALYGHKVLILRQ